MNNPALMKQVGVVVIGRNEGDRLKVCLESLSQFNIPVVYVDSGSIDGSIEAAKKMNAHVLNLDMSVPFTAARARNEGFELLLQVAPQLQYVQFVDGDCEVVESWLSAALSTFEKNARLAVVCGRRKERYPEQTFYNFICDLEWNTPIGEAKSCGGDALMKVEALQAVNGYNALLIAGEEPELCVRLRADDWKIQRIAEDMTIHDAAIKQFSQWWKRSVRAGHAYAQGAFMHGEAPEKHCVTQSRRSWVWGFFIPAALLLIACFISPEVALLISLIYVVQWLRLAYQNKKHGACTAFGLAYYLIVGKFAELQGQLSFHWNRLFKKKAKLIEYK